MPKFTRSNYDQKIKQETAESVLAGRETREEAAKRLDVQPSQIDSWIGECARRGTLPNMSGGTGTYRALTPDDATEPDLERAIGRWYIESHLAKRKADPDKPK